MNVSDSVVKTVIDKARNYWNLGDATITLVAARENLVYRVDTLNGPYALRLHRKGYRSVGEVHSELMWMSMLEENDVSVPKPVRTNDDETIKITDDVVVDMLSWIEGKSLKQLEPTEDIYHDLGVLLARMHELADAWPLPDSFERPTWNLVGDEPSWGKFWENPRLTDKQKTSLLDFRNKARTALENLQQPDRGLIHADLVPDNVLCNEGKLQPIDFDDGGFGYRLFDLATITHRSKRVQNPGLQVGEQADDQAVPLADKLANAVVAGYQKQRPLDYGSLPLFEALRACTYVGWNITRMDEPGGIERNKRFIAEAELAVNNYFAANDEARP